MLAQHLAPADTGPDEGAFLSRLFADPEGAPRGEVFNLLSDGEDIADVSENEVTQAVLLPRAGRALADRLGSIQAYEDACAALEEAFSWIRFLSTQSRDRPISAQTFAQESRTRALASDLPRRIMAAEQALAVAPLGVQKLFSELAKGFDGVRDPEALFEAVLLRHAEVQGAKPPEGKRSWFERSPDGATFVRVPYRVSDRPASEPPWNRPYRIATVLSFLDDLKANAHEPA